MCQAPDEERWLSQQFVCLVPLELLCMGKCFLHLSEVEAQNKESREKTKPKLMGAKWALTEERVEGSFVTV